MRRDWVEQEGQRLGQAGTGTDRRGRDWGRQRLEQAGTGTGRRGRDSSQARAGNTGWAWSKKLGGFAEVLGAEPQTCLKTCESPLLPRRGKRTTLPCNQGSCWVGHKQ